MNQPTRRIFVKGVAVAGLAAHPVQARDKADELFHRGDFDAANALYRQVLARDPDHVHALAQHAYVTLLEDRLPVARRLLHRVLRLEPGHVRARKNLADALWRSHAFEELAALLPSVRDDAPSATPAQLRSFAGRRPYRISGPGSVRIPFAATDPLPMVEASLNGAPPALFFLDTGALFALNEDYADRLGIPMYGHTTGRTMYGEHKAYQGRVDRLTLGGLDIERLPVHTIPDAIRLTAPDGRTTQGAIGTSVLARFLATIDYPGRALVLNRNRRAPLAATHSAPMWFVGDHFPLSHGTVNHLDKMVFFVDTGGGDIGFTAPRATFTAAGMEVPEGDGTHPVTVERVTLGSAVRERVPGLTGAFPEWFENGFGFRIGGLPTHEFFRPYALTFDFARMRILMNTPS
ncbi:Tetratricopeptide repeat-containing protein [Nonomuraea solani]|uniref:Tetratricopeptide repeat-containing protein n=1 Tax=Nonomuraea solani TaxID=1144553 RepID=A0A1H5TV61_9ACTN|nr:retropepsin-like aspartic protease [Nonomuraea solani]SEF65867.1 Tetratricopeptide repeat-containing protein [Nonomuraea solani]